jgi:hypothetical protein
MAPEHRMASGAANEVIAERQGGNESIPLRPRLTTAHIPLPPAQLDEAELQVIFGSEDWHSTVPPEWVPVITRDAARQRRQAAPPMFSDAYLAGMPNKRRKMMSRDRQQEEFADVRLALPETLRRSAQLVGARALTSADFLSRDAASDEQLCEAFRLEVSAIVRRRLADDPDYSAERFPNTEKYFKE